MRKTRSSPLTTNPSLSRTYGTRHRAAIGLSEVSDAIVIVVSEETRAVMRERTDWGGLLDPEAVQNVPSPDEARETLRRPDW